MEVSAKEIGIQLGNRKILGGVTINAEKKEFIGIIGPNGSGKSTLLKCIYRILKPENGQIYLSNK